MQLQLLLDQPAQRLAAQPLAGFGRIRHARRHHDQTHPVLDVENRDHLVVDQRGDALLGRRRQGRRHEQQESGDEQKGAFHDEFPSLGSRLDLDSTGGHGPAASHPSS
jgi:hypothetical protein